MREKGRNSAPPACKSNLWLPRIAANSSASFAARFAREIAQTWAARRPRNGISPRLLLPARPIATDTFHPGDPHRPLSLAAGQRPEVRRAPHWLQPRVAAPLEPKPARARKELRKAQQREPDSQVSATQNARSRLTNAPWKWRPAWPEWIAEAFGRSRDRARLRKGQNPRR